MAAASLRQMVGHKGLKSGTLVWEFATPGIGHLLSAGGCDFVFLCAEHSGFGSDTLKSVLRYFEAAGVPALVRPPGKTYPHIANTLDSVLFALVETAEGVANVEEIAATDGIDGLWIGHLDLSTSLGIPGEFDHPDYVAAVQRIERAAARADKSLGRAVGGAPEGAALYEKGYDFIALNTDTAIYLDALSQAVTSLRASCA